MASCKTEDYETARTLPAPTIDPDASTTTWHLSHADLSISSDSTQLLHNTKEKEEFISSTGGRRTSSKGKISLSAYQAQRSREVDMTKDMKDTGQHRSAVKPICVQVIDNIEIAEMDAPGSPFPSEATALPITSTPVTEGPNKRTNSACSYDITKEQVHFSPECYNSDDQDSIPGSAENMLRNSEVSSDVAKRNKTCPLHLEVLDPEDITVPIQGYEIMEQRARFTVFKLKVCRSAQDCWYVFRRYTDFVQLNDKLFVLFPSFRLSLPPKKWFGSNFDPIFLEDRVLGLQAFVNNITGHKEVCNSKPVREFFCFDDPPGPHDSLEESRALCEALEEQVYNAKKLLQGRNEELSIVREERDMYKSQVESLQRALRVERTLNGRTRVSPVSPQSSDTSLAECDQPTMTESETELTEHVDTKETVLADTDHGDVRTLSPESGICEGNPETPTGEIPEGGAFLSTAASIVNIPLGDGDQHVDRIS